MRKNTVGAKACIANFTKGRKPERSSKNPVTINTNELALNAANQDQDNCPLDFKKPVASPPPMTHKKLSQIAIPPARGIGVEWIRRSPGISISPRRGPSDSMVRFRTSDTNNDSAATIKGITIRELTIMDFSLVNEGFWEWGNNLLLGSYPHNG